jgi:hypothetical protein
MFCSFCISSGGSSSSFGVPIRASLIFSLAKRLGLIGGLAPTKK